MSVLESSIEPFSIEEPEQEAQQFEEDAKKIAAVGSDTKWQAIEDYCRDRISFYRDDLAGLDLKDTDLARVGEKYLVCSLVAMEFQALMDKVRVTTEAVNDSRKR